MDVLNTWFRCDKHPLKKSVEQFAKFPIATNYEENQKQPRLLLVSVDVQEGEIVTFDSYPKQDGLRKSEYGDYREASGDNGKTGYGHIIRYDDGIKSNYVIASASVPINYDYAIIEEVDRSSKLYFSIIPSKGWHFVPLLYQILSQQEQKGIRVQNPHLA